MAMNFQHIRHFLVAADTGNMLKAAEAMHISQSGLSRSIGALENLLGLPLFERSAKGIELTAFGKRFYPHARLMMNQFKSVNDDLDVFKGLQSGSLSLGINNSFAYVVVPEVIAELVRRWPGIHVDIMSANYSKLTDALSKGDIEMAFSLYLQKSELPHLSYEPLVDITTRVFARADHPIRKISPLHSDDLARWPWALINGASAQAAFEGHFASAGIEPPGISMQCSSVALLASVVAQSDLLTILPEELVQSTRGFSIEPLETEFGFGVARLGIIRRKGALDSPIADRLSRLLRTRAASLGEDRGHSATDRDV